MSKTFRRAAFLAATAAVVLAPAFGFAANSPVDYPPVTGMPQLAFAHPVQGRYLIAQVVWMMLIFAALYWAVKNIGLPRVAAVLEARQKRIQGDLETAQKLKEDADAAMVAHREATARARAEAVSSVSSAVQAAEQENQKRSEALNARLAAQIEEAEARIERARAAAMGALREVASETTAAVVGKLVGSADPQAVSAAVDRELAARGRA